MLLLVKGMPTAAVTATSLQFNSFHLLFHTMGPRMGYIAVVEAVELEKKEAEVLPLILYLNLI